MYVVGCVCDKLSKYDFSGISFRFKIMAEDDIAAMPPGPSTAFQFADWPSRLVQKVFCCSDGNEARIGRLHAMLKNGVDVVSDYSGLSGEHEVLFQLEEALNRFDSVKFGTLSIIHHRTCDCAKLPQKVLSEISAMNSADQTRAMCVLEDINDRIPEFAAKVLNAAMPAANEETEKAAQAFGMMDTYLRQNEHHIFGGKSKSFCQVHQQQCFAFPQFHDLTTDCDTDERNVIRQPQSSRLQIGFAGTTCKGWSAAGKSRHFADVSERPHAIWLNERHWRALQCLEDVFFSECTPRYPVQVGVFRL